MEINFASIEKKWQGRWDSEKTFEVSEDSGKPKFYVLEMFPYPSGEGLHMGHALNYTIGDILARFKTMKGESVLHPIGYDALGLPAENAAIKAGTHPEDYTNNAIKNFMKQQKALGVSYDWSRVVNTASSDYYKWDQWIFLKMMEKGLAYQKEASVNWCPKCNTVLANEQVAEGKCWRHEDTDVEVRRLRQWFFKTTEYADELLNGLDKIDWPERTKAMQRNWIGRSEGTEIEFEVEAKNNPRTSTNEHESKKLEGKEFVFLHGYKFGMDDDFWKWLEDEIVSHGGKVVFNKTLPNRTKPNLKEQMEFVLDNCKLNKNSVIIAHSLGVVLAMKLIPKLKDKIDKLLIVACPSSIKFHDENSDETRRKINSYCDWNFDYNSVKNNASEIVMLVDKNDSVPRHESAKETAEKLSINPKFVSANNKHFNSEQEPTIIEEILTTDNTDDTNKKEDVWKVFTTRPDTIFGVTFMVVAAGHERLDELVTDEQRGAVDEFLKKMSSVSEKDIGKLDKEGVFTGSYAINPANGERIPIWVGNFVLADYGSGMVMAVPAHDQRDFEFATKYGIEVKQVVAPFIKKNVDEDKETKERCTVFGIVKNPKTNQILCLDWKKIGWKAFPAGGVDEGEDVIDAVIREIKEETGYKNLKFIKKIGGELYQNFYRPHKGNNVYCKNEAYCFELVNEERDDVDASETEKHEAVWVNEDKVKDFVNVFGPEVVWDWYLNGDSAFTGEGVLCNSGEFNKMDNIEAKTKITDWLNKKGIAKRVVNFKLRDWGVSRQRYWGTPIPVVYCESCGAVPVPEDKLPIKLPKKVEFGVGNPLETAEDWIKTKCPKCKGEARRETDTMDTFVNSSWYFLRYTDPNNSEKIFDSEKANFWNPVDVYIGGAEHACMHLIYARFYSKFLRDLGLVNFDEPFRKLFHQGMLHAEDGRKMSKSLGNVVDPLDTIKKFGVDATRWFLVSVASPDKNFDWSEKGIMGAVRFIKKFCNFFDLQMADGGWQEDSVELASKLNLSIKNVGEYYGNFDYRKATIELRELFDLMNQGCSEDCARKFLKLIAPIVPHVAEELWEKMGETEAGCRVSGVGGRGADKESVFISTSEWPEFDEGKILEKGEVGDLNGKIAGRIKEILKDNTEKVYVYVMPFELNKVDGKVLSEETGKDVKVFAVNDANKVDPKGMAKRARPGMAAIYLE